MKGEVACEVHTVTFLRCNFLIFKLSQLLKQFISLNAWCFPFKNETLVLGVDGQASSYFPPLWKKVYKNTSSPLLLGDGRGSLSIERELQKWCSGVSHLRPCSLGWLP